MKISDEKINESFTVNAAAIDIEDTQNLKQEWLSLESKTEPSFFLSWAWIGVWLKTYRPQAFILRIHFEDELIALAIIVKASQKRHHFLHARSLHFHQTGHPMQDQIWIEYNGLLAQSTHHENAVSALFNYLTTQDQDWDELVIGAITDDEADLWAHKSGLYRHNLWTAPSYGIDLKALKSSGQPYLNTLSRNTRYQIRRSQRKYEAIGPITITRATNTNEALEFFEQAGPLHLKRWGNQLGQSGFANENFMAFHCTLIQETWPTDNIDLIKLQVDNKPIAFFYNFIYKKRVYFYLCALKQEQDSTLKPGLMGHALCIQHYLGQGLEYYDFMGGNDRYKASLGKKAQQLYQMTLQKDLYKFKVERFGRKLKWSLRKK